MNTNEIINCACSVGVFMHFWQSSHTYKCMNDFGLNINIIWNRFIWIAYNTLLAKKVGIVLNYAIQNSRYTVHFLYVRFASNCKKIAKRIEIISEKTEIFTIDCYAMKCVHFKCDLRV